MSKYLKKLEYIYIYNINEREYEKYFISNKENCDKNISVIKTRLKIEGCLMLHTWPQPGSNSKTFWMCAAIRRRFASC